MMRSLKEIKLLRQKLGITQQALAKLAGVSQSLITKVEAGKLDPTYTKAQKLFVALEQLEQKQSVKAEDLMNKKLISLSAHSSLKDAIKKMKKHGISQMPVFENNQCIGLVTESSLLDSLMDGASHDGSISTCLQASPPTIDKHATKEVVAGLLHYYPLILVHDQEKVLGFITISDLL